MSDRPLAGIEVIDLGQIYNGAYCSKLLAHLGAEVTKVEPPSGEPLRTRVESGEPPELIMLNSSKKGITMNLKSERGTELFTELVENADVLVENFATGTMERLGLGYDTLSTINPELIYAHSSGFGETGQKSDKLAMDLVIQAAGGVMDATGFSDGPPVKTGIAAGDFLGGTHLLAGILAALFERERTGEGQFVEVSMYDAIVPTLVSQFSAQYKDDDIPARTGNRHAGLAKCPYNAYETTDGYVAILCTTDDHWDRLLELIAAEGLQEAGSYDTNVERLDHMDEIDEVIGIWTRERSRHAIEELLTDAGIPCSAVQTINEVLHDPHLETREMITEIEHPAMDSPIRVPGSPVRFSNSALPDIHPSPRLGEHNRTVLGDKLGISASEIEALERDGVI